MTWGKRCVGFMVESTGQTRHDCATVNLPHFNGDKYQGAYKGIWQKVQSMISYIYNSNFLYQYDLNFISGDDA